MVGQINTFDRPLLSTTSLSYTMLSANKNKTKRKLHLKCMNTQNVDKPWQLSYLFVTRFLKNNSYDG